MAGGALIKGWICAALVLAAPLHASAQPHAVRLAPPACPPPWWDESAMLFALRVELRELEVDVDSQGEGDVLRVEPIDCADPDADIAIDLAGERIAFAQRLPIRDIVPELRLRAVALAIASSLREVLDTPPPPAPIAPTPIAPAPEPEIVPPAREEIPRESALRFAAAGSLYVLASANVFGGLDLGASLRVAPGAPFWIGVSVFALATSVGDPLGEIRALWLGGSIAIGVEAELDPVRLGARLGVSVGWVGAEGSPLGDAGGAEAHAAIAPLEIGGTFHWVVAPGAALTLGAGAGVFLAGWDFFAASRLKLALSGAAGYARAGLAFDL
jgi:hypothetical protein